MAIAQSLADKDPANIQWQSDLAVSLRIIATNLGQLHAYAEAADLARRAVQIERSISAPSAELAEALLNVSWHSLFIRDFAGAKTAGEESFSLDATLPTALTNVAPAAMFLGDRTTCLDLHAKYRNAVVLDDGTTWATAVRNNFAELAKPV